MCSRGKALLGVIGWLLLAGSSRAAKPGASFDCPNGYGVDDSGNVYVCGHAQPQVNRATAGGEHPGWKTRAIRRHRQVQPAGSRGRARLQHPADRWWPFEAGGRAPRAPGPDSAWS